MFVFCLSFVFKSEMGTFLVEGGANVSVFSESAHAPHPVCF